MVVSAQILSLHCCLLFVAVFFIRDSNFVALEFHFLTSGLFYIKKVSSNLCLEPLGFWRPVDWVGSRLILALNVYF